MVAFTFIGLIISFLLPYTFERWTVLFEWLHIKEEALLDAQGKLSVLVHTGQTVSFVAANHAATEGAQSLPPVFQAIVNVIRFLSFDLSLAMPGSGCFLPRFQDKLLLWTLGDVGVSALFLGAYEIARRKGEDDAWVYLRRFVDYTKFVLPAVTHILFQALSCKEYDAGDEGTKLLLLADHSVDCNSDSYKTMRVYAIIMIIVIDGGLGIIALRGLHQLRPTLLAINEAEMDEHPRLRNSPLRPLFADYKPFAAPYYGVGVSEGLGLWDSTPSFTSNIGTLGTNPDLSHPLIRTYL